MCHKPVRLRWIWLTTLWVIGVVTTGGSFAQTSTPLVGAGDGAFAGSATFGDVLLTGMRFGMGVDVEDGGHADGTFETTLLGVSVLGQPQVITVEADIAAGSISASGVASISGMSSVDMGDGSAPVTGVPFTLAVTPNASGQGTLVLVVGTTALPAVVVMQGGVTLPVCTPPEVGPTVVFLDEQSLSWSAPGGAASSNLYRGSIDGVAWAFNHACLAGPLPIPGATDTDRPPPGQAFYYLVSSRNACGESSLGVTSDGQQQPNSSPCP